MTTTGTYVTLAPRDYDAVLFDLDGVLTRTAAVHAAAWKRLFDEFLRKRAEHTGEPFVPFDIEADYRRYVDGKPRRDGVASFLASRGIDLPEGSADDAPDAPTVHGLARRKDDFFLETLARDGVEVFESSIALVRALRAQEIGTAVVSSSKNCKAVLERAGIDVLFDARVDGVDLERLGLAGKPAPDTFLEGARRLRVEPARCVVVEDAIAGVEAGRAGRFGLVIGVDRLGHSNELRQAGADVVVRDLCEIRVATEEPSAWELVYDAFDLATEGIRESLCALGNGYFETRGAVPWARADGVHYPGTYIAGGYNRVRTDIGGRVVENEDLVNFPNWLPLSFAADDGEWFDLREVTILEYGQELDLRRGMLRRCMRFEDQHGRRSALEERRVVSMADMHLAALELLLTPENWSGRATVRSAIDGRIVNAGAKLYEKFNNRHLEPVAAGRAGPAGPAAPPGLDGRTRPADDDGVYLLVHTTQSDLHVAIAARTQVFFGDELLNSAPRRRFEEPGYIGEELDLDVRQGETLAIEKIVALFTSRDAAISEASLAACKAVGRAGRFADLVADHVLAWKHLWRRYDVSLRPAGERFPLNVPMLLRLNMFHLLQAASLNSIGLDIGVPARGWTGEHYRGHVFWDELFIFPTLNFRTPEITRSLLMYRYRRLGEARAAARAAGYRGAMFPWQSGSDGQEETQELNLNPRSNRWVPDNTYLQRHVGSAIAYNVWQYFQVTADIEFMQFYGAELMLEIARFWASIAQFNEARGRYEIRGVMGPDEFHDAYPDAAEPGVNNNAYTNVMAVWVLRRALEVLDLLPDIRHADLMARLKLTKDEIERWRDVARRMFVPFHDDGIISQFEGYERLEELDWDDYRKRYGNIQRLELILEAENDSANRYKVSKQADVLMLFYLFSSKELGELLRGLGYQFEHETIPRNVDYYDRRSSHGSTLSRVVHAWVLARSDRPRAMRYFAEALQSDVGDIQQGTTAEGVHLGAMAGTVDLVQRVSTGIEVTGDVLRLNPQLPEELDRLDMRIRYRGHSLDLKLTRDALTVRGRESGAAALVPIRLGFRDEVHQFAAGSTRTFDLFHGFGQNKRHAKTPFAARC
ncbi:MAG TPA: beta-phosphoglucomutase family hydrolase [Gammaproteobacteria bacterium]|nr:beta-phosphoglucomutase family hydrolase [Gammaproteobacteria bacterium]